MPIAKEAWFYPLISPKDLEVVRTDFFEICCSGKGVEIRKEKERREKRKQIEERGRG